MSIHVMVDLETLSTGPDAAVISVGAVKFDPFDSDVQLDSYYQPITAESCQELGLKISAETVMWWFDPSQDDARKRYMSEKRMDLPSALEGFMIWFGNESIPVWGNGASFDNVILRNAFTRCGYEAPWKFWHDRCYRTFKNMAPGIEAPRPDTFHHALCDAVSQTRHMQEIVKHLRLEVL